MFASVTFGAVTLLVSVGLAGTLLLATSGVVLDGAGLLSIWAVVVIFGLLATNLGSATGAAGTFGGFNGFCTGGRGL